MVNFKNPFNGTIFKCGVCGKIITTKTIIKHNNIYLCQKHYEQLRKYGEYLDNNPRTIHDKNEFHVMGDITFIDLYNIKSEVIARVVIDTEDLDKVKDIKWKLSHGYAYNALKNIYMQNLIMGSNELIDHENHNTLNNRKTNLRIATKSQNQMNTYHKGVNERKDGLFYAYIKLNQKMINLGVYDTENEALFARWYAEHILFKEFKYPKDKPEISKEKENSIIEYVNKKISTYFPELDIKNVKTTLKG